jgi:hypothetical protein
MIQTENKLLLRNTKLHFMCHMISLGSKGLTPFAMGPYPEPVQTSSNLRKLLFQELFQLLQPEFEYVYCLYTLKTVLFLL